MSLRTSPWPAGIPCWADLTVPDVAAATAFYAEALGWTYRDTEAEYGGYVIAEAHGAAAAGIGSQQQPGPCAWTLYFATDDAEAAAGAVTEHGGRVLLAPGDVGSLGRMCIAADPTGASFGLWQAGTFIGAGVVNEPGGLSWEDLHSPDPDAARSFYTALFGYRTDPLPGATPDYTTFGLAGDETPLGGIGGMRGDEGPAHWLVYFGVADAGAAVGAVQRGGGSVLLPQFDTPFGPMASLADPTGAEFWIVQTDGQGQPDRSG